MSYSSLSDVWITIFFGASSGKVFGNVTVKRPSFRVALTCSSYTNNNRSVGIYSEIFKRKGIPVHLQGAGVCAITCHEGVRVEYIPSQLALQTS